MRDVVLGVGDEFASGVDGDLIEGPGERVVVAVDVGRDPTAAVSSAGKPLGTEHDRNGVRQADLADPSLDDVELAAGGAPFTDGEHNASPQ